MVARLWRSKSRALVLRYSDMQTPCATGFNARNQARFKARLKEPFSPSIFFCNCRIAYNTDSGRGGQPGTYTSTRFNARNQARFKARLKEPFSPSIFFCNCRIAYNTDSGRGGQPGTYTST